MAEESTVMKPHMFCVTARVIAHHKDCPFELLIREDGLVGGKMDAEAVTDQGSGEVIGYRAEDLRELVVREWGEETGCEIVGVRREATLEMPDRIIKYKWSKWEKLGFALPEGVDPESDLYLLNSTMVIFSGAIVVPSSGIPKKHNRRKLKLIDTRESEELERLKPRHRMIAEAWRDLMADGTPFPQRFVWTGDGD